MKKILTVSLVAIMAVSAARADIASTEYVGKAVGASETTVKAYVDEKTQNIASSTQLETITNTIGTDAMGTDATTLTGAIAELNAEKANAETVNQELEKKVNKADANLTANTGTNEYIKTVAQTNGVVTVTTGAIDETASENSVNLITSGAVYKAVADATSDVTELGSRVTANEGAIADINNVTTGIAAVAAQNLADAKDELQDKIDLKANTADVAATYATQATVNDMDAAYKLADQTINTELAKKIDKTEVESTYATQATVNAMDAAYKLADQGINTELAKKIDKTEVESTYATQATVTGIDARVTTNEGAITALPNNYQAKAGEGLSIAQNGGWAVTDMPAECKVADVECALVATGGGSPKWQVVVYDLPVAGGEGA